MRTTPWLAAVLSSTALVACGGGGDKADAPPSIDSPPGTPDAFHEIDADPNAPDAPPEFACHGVPIPTSGAATVTVSGDAAALSVSGSTPIAGATVEGFIVGNNTPVATATTAADGAYSIAINNPGSTPIDGYLRMATTGNKTVYLFPPTLIYTDIPTAPLRTLPNSLYPAFLALAGGLTVGTGNGVIAVVVTDCLGNPLTGATVTSNPAPIESAEPAEGSGGVRYNGDNGLPSATATSTGADGIAYVVNVPGGTVSVDAVYNGIDFREHAFLVRAVEGTDNAINTTTIIP